MYEKIVNNKKKVMEQEHIKTLLVTANCGSVFEEVSKEFK